MNEPGVLERQTVIVRNGVIVEVGTGSSTLVPTDAARIDGEGGYLLPGLTDAHVHLRDISELLSYLAYGVTTVVHLSGPTGSIPDVVALRRQVANGAVLGPTIYTTGRILDGDPPVNPGVSTAVRTPQEARKAVTSQIDEGVDFIKVYNNLSGEALRAVIETAHQHGVAVFGHIPRADGRDMALQTALNAGLDVIAHGEEYFFTYFYADIESQLDRGEVPIPDQGLIPEAVQLTRDVGAVVIPNLSFVAMTRRQLDDSDSVLDDPESNYLAPGVQAMWKEQNPTRRPELERFDLREQGKYPFVRHLTAALNRAGVPLLLGTDASAPGLYPGLSAHLELRELVDAGLTPYEALLAATRNAGGFIGEHVPTTEPFGSVAAGQRADLLLVEGNPLADIANVSNVKGVMVRGKWLPRTELERRREEAALSYGR